MLQTPVEIGPSNASPGQQRVGDLKLIRIKILDLPNDTVAQSVERRRDKPRAWVRILASVRFLNCSVALFLLCYPVEALEGLISTVVCSIQQC